MRGGEKDRAGQGGATPEAGESPAENPGLARANRRATDDDSIVASTVLPGDSGPEGAEADEPPEVTEVGGRVTRRAAADIGAGAVLADRYQIEATLGEGGSGTVYRAWDRILGGGGGGEDSARAPGAGAKLDHGAWPAR